MNGCCARSPAIPLNLQIMYGVAGERRLPEYEAPWLAGFEGSKPVRIGNAAHEQLQLDVFGELGDALFQARRLGIPADPWAWSLEKTLLEDLEQRWHLPDHGIWEVRGPARHFTHSKIMAWVAFDRAIKSVERFGLDGPVDHWRLIRDQIHAEVCRRGYDSVRGTFTQSYDDPALDASLLLTSLVGFLPADDPRIIGTVRAIEHELLHDGLVLRYLTDAGTVGRRPPAGRGRLHPLQLLARRRVRSDGPTRRRPSSVRAAAGIAQRLRPALRGIRSPLGKVAGELSPGVLSLVSGEYRLQPDRRSRRPARHRAEAKQNTT